MSIKIIKYWANLKKKYYDCYIIYTYIEQPNQKKRKNRLSVIRWLFVDKVPIGSCEYGFSKNSKNKNSSRGHQEHGLKF